MSWVNSIHAAQLVIKSVFVHLYAISPKDLPFQKVSHGENLSYNHPSCLTRWTIAFHVKTAFARRMGWHTRDTVNETLSSAAVPDPQNLQLVNLHDTCSSRKHGARFGFQKNPSKNHGFAGNERRGRYETVKKGCHDYGDSVKSARNQRFIRWKIQISEGSWALSHLVQCLACQGGCKCILQLCTLVVFTLCEHEGHSLSCCCSIIYICVKSLITEVKKCKIHVKICKRTEM